jgi:hypothetical protein
MIRVFHALCQGIADMRPYEKSENLTTNQYLPQNESDKLHKSQNRDGCHLEKRLNENSISISGDSCYFSQMCTNGPSVIPSVGIRLSRYRHDIRRRARSQEVPTEVSP